MDTLRNGAIVCVVCGTVAVPVIVSTPAPHHARANCRGYGRWLKWLGQERSTEPLDTQGTRRMVMDGANYILVQCHVHFVLLL
jgi:hypothetical protein